MIHAREHLQSEPDTPCTTCRGAPPVPIAPPGLPPRLARPAIAATAPVGPPFAGVGLAVENGGVVFEADVQPAFVDGEAGTVAVPYVEAHPSAPAAARRARRAQRLPARGFLTPGLRNVQPLVSVG
ncbi:hypothetical protein [Streptomyces cinereospinus]|uniref:Uncharacterized protein n=1 Tax=Streptomyces cinereospinus TaxID=285561 RepID=A0ABV5N0Z8_9ACTN